MTQTHQPGSQSIDSYLSRVDAAARNLPPDRRVELLDQLREHLDAAANAPGATEASVLGAIDRLGDPTEIAASERDGPTPPAGTGGTPRNLWGPLEIIAVVLLIVGPFVAPVVGPLAGLVCAWVSPAWTRAEKWVATVLASGATVFVAVFFLASFI